MRYPTYYKLDGHTPVPVDNILEWGVWFQTSIEERIVKQDGDEGTGWWVSTVFLALDHAFMNGPPVLFETLVFAPKTVPPALAELDGQMERYSTWEEAEAGHRRMCARVRAALEGL